MNTNVLIGTTMTALFCTAAAFADPLSYSNETGGSVTFYGQVSPTYLGFDDGMKSYDNIADNAHSNTRLGFNLDQELEGGNKLRFNFETGLGLPQTSKFNQDVDPVWSLEKTDIRKVEFIFSGNFGKVSVGQGSMASDSTATADLSRTTMASTVATSDTIGSYFLRRGDGELSDIKFNNVFSDYDGSRKGRIRYDTPSFFNGITLAAAYGQEILRPDGDRNYYDIGLHYDGDAGDLKMQGGLGYGWIEDDGDTTSSYAGSFSVLHTPTGLNGTVALGGDSEDSGTYAYGKIGWISEFWDAGYTALSADYYSGRDFVSSGSESTEWGLQLTQKIDAWNLEAYLAYAAYTFDDDTGVNYEDANSTLLGMRWKF